MVTRLYSSRDAHVVAFLQRKLKDGPLNAVQMAALERITTENDGFHPLSFWSKEQQASV